MVKTTNQLYVIHVYLFIQVPSGKHLHNYGKIHHTIYGKINYFNYFYGHVPLLFVSLPGGKFRCYRWISPRRVRRHLSDRSGSFNGGRRCSTTIGVRPFCRTTGRSSWAMRLVRHWRSVVGHHISPYITIYHHISPYKWGDLVYIIDWDINLVTVIFKRILPQKSVQNGSISVLDSRLDFRWRNKALAATTSFSDRLSPSYEQDFIRYLPRVAGWTEEAEVHFGSFWGLVALCGGVNL